MYVYIIPDGNCLFRCFSYFLYNNEHYFHNVREVIVNYVVEHWDVYQYFIIGKNYYPNISSKNDYRIYMIQNAVYGTEN